VNVKKFVLYSIALKQSHTEQRNSPQFEYYRRPCRGRSETSCFENNQLSASHLSSVRQQTITREYTQNDNSTTALQQITAGQQRFGT